MMMSGFALAALVVQIVEANFNRSQRSFLRWTAEEKASDAQHPDGVIWIQDYPERG
jgi:hypothetical protein